MTTDTAVLGFDPYDYAFQDDPYPVYARLRADEPLHHNPDHDLWVLTRHADVSAALRNDAVFSNAMGVSIDASAWHKDAHRVMSFLAMDAPRATRLRSLVSRGFTPRRVRELAPQIQRIANTYLDQALQRDSFDWIEEAAGKVPMDVISEMLGVPEPDRDEVRRLADLVVHREEGLHDVPQSGIEASLELVTYYLGMLAERRKTPTDDLTSALLTAEIDGDRLSEEEVVAFMFLMVVAGNETTTKLLGNALFHLARHPEQQAAVFSGPDQGVDLVEPWIEETLRFDTSSQMIARHLLADLEVEGTVAPKGSKLLLVLGSANRDERVFSRPDEFDIFRDRDEISRMVSFGGGRHFCLGANLARLEAQITLRELVRRVGTLEVHHDRAVRVHSTNVRGFSELPVTVKGR